MPPPPSRVTEIEMAPIVKESLPAPLVIERVLTSASGRLVVTPSTVTEMLVASAATEIVCADPSEIDRVHGAGPAGGDGPLPGTAAGSSEGSVALVGVVVDADGSVALVLVVDGAQVPEDDAPAAPVAPASATLPVSFCVLTRAGPPEELAVT